MSNPNKPNPTAVLEADLRAVVLTDQGARVLRWILYEVLKLEDTEFAVDPLLLAARQGRRVGAGEIVTLLRSIDLELFRRVVEARFKSLREQPPQENPDAR